MDSVTAPAKGGRGGGGAGGGEGGGGGGWEETHHSAVLPPTDSPNPLEEAKLHRRTLGLIDGFTQRDPPVALRGVSGEGTRAVGRGLEVGNRGNPNRNL